MINTSTTTTTTSTGTRLAPALDRKLADTEQPLFDVVNWYGKAFAATNNLESDRSVNEDAALWLGIEEFKSEGEIGTRPCQCTRPDPNVCECWETLKAARAALAHAPTQEEARPIREEVADHVAEVKRELANRMREALRSRGDKVIPHHIGLWSAVRFLAPLGDDLAQGVLGLTLRTPSQMNYDDTQLPEILFQDRRYSTLLYEAFAAHRSYRHCDPAPIIRRWQGLGIAEVESAYLVDWFCATHPMRARRVERDLKIKMRKQGWPV